MNNQLTQLIELANANLLDSALSPMEIAISLFVTLAISLFIFFIYKITYNGALYSRNFNITLIMTALIVNAIMIGINGSIVLSLGMVGALSVIRFRTAVKDPKDTGFLFWAVAVGVINGVAYYALSLIATLFISGVLIIFSKMKDTNKSYVLILHLKKENDQLNQLISQTFKKHLIKTETRSENQIEKVLEVSSPNQSTSIFLDQIQKLPDIINCTLLSNQGEIAE